MSSEPPPGSGQQPPEDDPLRKRPPGEQPGEGAGSPYDPRDPGGGPGGVPPGGGQGGGPYGGPPGGGPYGGPPDGGQGGGPYGGGSYPTDPLAGMPPLADSVKRTLARIIDVILVGIVVWLLTWGFGVNEYDVDGDRIEAAKSFWQSAIATVLYIAYDTLLTARTGQTLGKKLLHLRVANLDNGATPSVQNALVRAAVLWIPCFFCCFCVWLVVSGGWILFDRPYKQGLHDKAAKTVVVSSN